MFFLLAITNFYEIIIRMSKSITVQKYHLVKIYQIFFLGDFSLHVVAFHSFETGKAVNTLHNSHIKAEYCNLPVLNIP